MTVLAWFPRLAGAFAAFLLSINIAGAAPAITLTPGFGPPTTILTVGGTGYGATQLIDIYLDTTNMCLSIADTAGAFSCTFKIPKDAQPQSHWVTAVQRGTSTGAQKAFMVRTDWAQFHGLNAKHTGYNQYENTINVSNVLDLDIAWQAPVGAGAGGTSSTPAVVGGRVYTAGRDGKLYSLYYKDGTPFANFPKILGGPVYGSPAVGGGRVYVATHSPDNALYAFNATNGAAIAGFPIILPNAIVSSPAIFGGNVYIGCTDGSIYAFNAVTGVALAGFPVTTGGAVTGTPTIANGRIYVGAADSNFYAFDATTGATIAGYPKLTGGDIQSTAAIVGNQVFFGSNDFKLYGLRGPNGINLTGFPVSTSAFITSSPAIASGLVIAPSQDGRVQTYATTTGAGRWSLGLDDAIVGSPVVANGVVFINTMRSLYALNSANGAILWRAAVSSFGNASPVVADGIVYLGSSDGSLYAFSVFGDFPASRLLGGLLGVKPAISSLKPDLSLRVSR